jgi:hypothetical protein
MASLALTSAFGFSYLTSVLDPDHFDVDPDPDPALHFYVDLDKDPPFQFGTDPDLDLAV